MGDLTIGGLASGLDTNGIIDGLTNIEQGRVTREERKVKSLEEKQKAYDDLYSRVGNLASKAAALQDPAKFNLFSTTSSDEEVATVTGDENAVPGKFEVEVLAKAVPQKAASKGFTSIVSQLGFAGSFTLSRSREALEKDPTLTPLTLDVRATDTLKDLVARINASESTGVQASILSLGANDNRLVLTGTDQGTDGFVLEETTGSPLSSGLGIIQDQQAQRSQFALVLRDGGPATGATTFDALLSGIGANNLDAGDQIKIAGVRADNGSAVSANFDIYDTFGAPKSVSSLLTEIQSAFGNTVNASLNSSGEIVLKDTANGTSSLSFELSLVDSGNASSLQLGKSKGQNVFQNLLNEGKRSFFKVDNLSVSAQSNSADNVVRGATFNLLKVTAPGESVQLGLDRDMGGIKEKISSFVNEYNLLMKFIEEKTKVSKKDSTDTTGTDKSTSLDTKEKVTTGVFTGDSFVRRIGSDLQKLVTGQVDALRPYSNYTSLASMGIVSSQYNGQLEIDDTKLSKALKTDFEGVRSLFATTGRSDNPNFELGRYTKDSVSGTYTVNADADVFDGDSSSGNDGTIATRIGDVLTSSAGGSKGLSIKAPVGTGSGTFTFIRGLASQLKSYNDMANEYSSGFFKQNKSSIAKSISDQETRVADMQTRVDSFRARLVAQFSAMEQSMQNLKSQSSSFSAQMGSL